jgi:hypothetical protein
MLIDLQQRRANLGNDALAQNIVKVIDYVASVSRSPVRYLSGLDPTVVSPGAIWWREPFCLVKLGPYKRLHIRVRGSIGVLI